MEEISLYNVTTTGEFGFEARLFINNTPVTMELDTGSALTIRPYEVFEQKLGWLITMPSNVKLLTYSDHDVQVLGQVDMLVTYGSKKFKLPLVVVKLILKISISFGA